MVEKVHMRQDRLRWYMCCLHILLVNCLDIDWSEPTATLRQNLLFNNSPS